MTVFLAMLVLLGACKKETVRTELEIPKDCMHLQVSAPDVQISFFDAEKEAVVFSWEPTGFEAKGIPYRYFFKMDVAGNNFATSTDKMEVTGRNSISFTNLQMEQYLNKWKIKSGTKVGIEAEIIAQPVESESIENAKYRRPEVSKTEFSIVNNTEIYLVVNDRNYRLTGNELLLYIAMGTYNCTAGENDAIAIEIPADGLWSFYLDYDERTVKVRQPGLWLLGDACEAGWNIPYMPEFTENGSIRTWRGTLLKGELKFALEINDTWDFNIPYLMPQENGSELKDGTIQFVPANSITDNKWKVSRAGDYSITVDISAMTVKFDLNSPLDLKWDGIWMVGDATEGGWWSDPFKISLNYDFRNSFKGHSGVFFFEGPLTEGEFKFPLEERHFEVPYLMPEIVDGNGLATLPGNGESCRIEFVDRGGYDHKWKVTSDRAGSYRLVLDTEEMTMTVYQL